VRACHSVRLYAPPAVGGCGGSRVRLDPPLGKGGDERSPAAIVGLRRSSAVNERRVRLVPIEDPDKKKTRPEARVGKLREVYGIAPRREGVGAAWMPPARGRWPGVIGKA
jgi:hypothetical protein